jgi:7,8-dihydropterin-6-yl-methyl-4-(beta-D-ribofuranosyl)aminobenzene 5'-phosphate synthase
MKWSKSVNMNRKIFSGCATIIAVVALAGVGMVLVRLMDARQQLSQPAIPDWPVGADFGSVSELTILPLLEAEAGSPGLHSEHGLSYLIQAGGSTILLDVGNNLDQTEPAPLLRNMQQLGVSLSSIDALVISHNHPDHVGGQRWWLKGSFSIGSSQAALEGKDLYVPVELTYPGSSPQVVLEPHLIAPGVASLGRQPFLQPFPFWLWRPLEYEQSLVINVDEYGLVLVTGCGHPGMEQIVARAEGLFEQPVVGIVGGLHYLNMGAAELAPHIDYLAARNPQLVALSPHDNGPGVIQVFERAFPEEYRYIKVGQPIHFPFQTALAGVEEY